MDDLISRQVAIATAISGRVRTQDGEDWIRVSEVRESLYAVPSIDAVPVVRCKECKHRPKGTGANHDLEFPDNACPCQNPDDYWYSWKPDDDWFCADGERKES